MIKPVEDISKSSSDEIKSVVDGLAEMCEERNIEALLVVGLMANGDTYIHWTEQIATARIVGAMEVAKHDLLSSH